jgi:hypothetical protein
MFERIMRSMSCSFARAVFCKDYLARHINMIKPSAGCRTIFRHGTSSSVLLIYFCCSVDTPVVLARVHRGVTSHAGHSVDPFQGCNSLSPQPLRTVLIVLTPFRVIRPSSVRMNDNVVAESADGLPGRTWISDDLCHWYVQARNEHRLAVKVMIFASPDPPRENLPAHLVVPKV